MKFPSFFHLVLFLSTVHLSAPTITIGLYLKCHPHHKTCFFVEAYEDDAQYEQLLGSFSYCAYPLPFKKGGEEIIDHVFTPIKTKSIGASYPFTVNLLVTHNCSLENDIYCYKMTGDHKDEKSGAVFTVAKNLSNFETPGPCSRRFDRKFTWGIEMEEKFVEEEEQEEELTTTLEPFEVSTEKLETKPDPHSEKLPRHPPSKKDPHSQTL